MLPYFEEDGVSLYFGSALEILRELPAESINCCVTSPPYFGLRDYGIDGQIGLERTWPEYVTKLVGVFAEVRRVLRDDGTLWLNLGDSYATGAGSVGECPGGGEQGERWKGYRGGHDADPKSAAIGPMTQANRLPQPDLKPKDLMMIPARVAIALQADGWYLRSDIIWAKPAPMPESVTDRPTRSHEHIFLLSKNESYYYDQESIMEPTSGNAHCRGNGVNPKAQLAGVSGSKQNQSFSAAVTQTVDERNKRDVWMVNAKPFLGAHFATFPPELILPCILAGCPLGGVVLDPFSGAATTALVSKENGRRCIGIELNEEYLKMSVKRLSQSVFAFD